MSAILLTALIFSGCGGVDPPVIEEPHPCVKITPAEIAEKYGSCVVSIKAFSDDGIYNYGSGVIFDEADFIVTNDHVIRGKTSSIEVYLADKRVLKAKLVATDPRMDLAVIKVEGDNLQAIKFGDSGEMKKGDEATAIGNPHGLEDTVTPGHISNLDMDMNEELTTIRCLQTDAAINPGNSGGALFNEYGELIGINVMIQRDSDNIGFAIPSNDVKKVVEQLKDDVYVTYPYLGIDAVNVKTDKGEPYIFVRQVRENSQASKAGLQKGDVIFRINDARVEIVPKLRDQINNNKAGNMVSVYILRQNAECIKEVTL